MSKSSIKVIFFDAAGTLFNIRGSVADVYLQYAKKYGVRDTPDVKSAVNAAFASAFRQAPPPVFAVSHPDQLKQCERLWWFDIVHAVFYRVGMFDGFDDYFDEVFEAFSGGRHWKVDPALPAVLETLKDSGYELGIVSNFDTRLYQILQDLLLRSYFDTVTISSVVRAVKPSQQIFQYALNEHAVEPWEALHIGDHLTEDWEGATNAGLHAVLLSCAEQLPGSVTCIRSLKELPEMLDGDFPNS